LFVTPSESVTGEQQEAWGDDDLSCTHCGGEGFCWDGADPLGDCPDDIHNCHACNGSGRQKDQVIF
jgi:DnaJ-class molecular chaperone